MTSEHFNRPHEPPITLEALVNRLHRSVIPGAELVLIEDRHKLPNLHRWIVGVVDETTFSPIEVWLPADEHDQVFAALGRVWKPIWGTADTARAMPAAQV